MFSFDDEVNKLLKAAEGYKGTDNIYNQLLYEAMSDGYKGDYAKDVVEKVLSRLNKSESGKKGGKLGVAHDPTKQTNRLAKIISELRNY